ncbi:hypothetical protein ASD83_18700 [Devosia sp. Root685]|uniref:hypothetical protein n=1 Tax=Devosia sp. Root685 TaxID=1736587 RepID=UPI0006F22739|nr:hypothetical protein [Devosia sp. Root685]KRA95675.1 hypothetical protein ASD83_18700 [Devosia sp. Root685]
MMSKSLAGWIVGLFLLLTGGALAQDASTRVLVPDAPGGSAVVAGCYQADRNLYGANRLTFCLERRGNYSVRGQGVRCEGRLDWRASGRDVTIDLRRQSCSGGMAWAAATITCRPRGLIDLILSEIFKNQTQNNGRVLVPDHPQVGSLRCTYRPTVPGAPNATFVARRL